MIAFLLFLLGICIGFVFGATAVNRQIKQVAAKGLRNGYISVGGECFKVEKMEAK